jgi:hypothetical protein
MLSLKGSAEVPSIPSCEACDASLARMLGGHQGQRSCADRAIRPLLALAPTPQTAAADDLEIGSAGVVSAQAVATTSWSLVSVGRLPRWPGSGSRMGAPLR